MRLATTTGDILNFCESEARAVRCFEGTGFRHLDYSFYNAAKPGLPFLGDRWMDAVIASGKEAEKLGFDFVQAHSPGNNFLAEGCDYELIVKANIRAIEACGYLGIPKLVVHSGFTPRIPYDGGREVYFAENRDFYARLYPAMEKNKVHVLIENSAFGNMGKQYFFMTGQEMTDFIAYCGHPLLGACWDVGHANMDDRDQYAEMMTLGESLQAVHMQDNFGQSDQHIAPLMGTLDINSVMCALQDSGFIARDGVFTFEADSLLLRGGRWPASKRAVAPEVQSRMSDSAREIRRASIRMLYELGVRLLQTYGISAE